MIRQETFMPDMMSEAEIQSKYCLSWLCDFNPSEDAYEAFCMQILSSILLEGPSAPFYKSIIEKNIAPSFCPGAGFDHTTRQATFTIGV